MSNSDLHSTSNSKELIERIEADRRILERLDRTGDCWRWTGKLDERGRGRVWHEGKLKLHHRAVWEILKGPIPPDALLCHHCDNPTCANPEHLYVGDPKSNAADMSRRKRTWAHRNPDKAYETGLRIGHANTWARGTGNPKAKLSPEQVSEIRKSAGSSYEVAARYGVNATTIQRIRKGEAWTGF